MFAPKANGAHFSRYRSSAYELKFYLERKMLEDPFQKTEGLIEDFMTRYYGAAGGKILEARKLLDRRRREKKAFIRGFSLMGRKSRRRRR